MTRFVTIAMASVAAATVPMQGVQGLQLSAKGGRNEENDKEDKPESTADYAAMAGKAGAAALNAGAGLYGLIPGTDPKKVQKMKDFVNDAPKAAGKQVSLGAVAGCSSGCWAGTEIRKQWAKAGGIVALLCYLKNQLGFVNADVDEVKERAEGVKVKAATETTKGGSEKPLKVRKGEKMLPVFTVSKTEYGCNMSEGDVVIAFGEDRQNMHPITEQTAEETVNASDVKYWEVEGRINKAMNAALDRDEDGVLGLNDVFVGVDQAVSKLTGGKSNNVEYDPHAAAKGQSQGCGFKAGFIVGLCCGIWK